MTSAAPGFSITYKLALLAGIPVVGALVLSWMVISTAQEQVRSAEALGSVEDLAALASKASYLVQSLQTERAELAMQMGKAPTPEIQGTFKETDAALADLQTFLASRDLDKLPDRLAGDLKSAQERLDHLSDTRTLAANEVEGIIEVVDFYGGANGKLISTIAALNQLSNDGALLRTISLMVAVLSLTESASKEQAVVADVFARSSFAPGAYKKLVTLVTEYQSDERVFEATADEVNRKRYKEVLQGEFAEKTNKMRTAALETMDDDFGIKPEEWMAAQGARLGKLRDIERALRDDVTAIVLARLNSTQQTLYTGSLLSGGILLFSMLMALFIGRGVSRSVSSLSVAAMKVQTDRDYTVRAHKVSDDELGVLTEAFNEMLNGIQARDTELEHHRENLEQLVSERTAQLQARNEEMRVVLDNVEQGLATVQMDGTLSQETSSRFVNWFGAPAEGTAAAEHFERFSSHLAMMFEMGWESLLDDMLPWEMCLDQMPQEMVVDGRYYRFEYRGITNKDDALQGVLLVVSDVTTEVEQAKRDAVQREMIHIFTRMAEDRSGVVEFVGEAKKLIELTRHGNLPVPEMMRTVHTIKGNCSIFGISSVAAAAHDLESFIVAEERMPEPEKFEALFTAWDDFESRVSKLLPADNTTIELGMDELEELVGAVERGTPKKQLVSHIRSLRFEPVEKRLARVGEQARSLTQRLGKGELALHIDADNVRLPSEGWNNFFSTLVHAVRNSVDHGFESPEERRSIGKEPSPGLHLRFKQDRDWYRVELQDDGRGVNWEKVTEKAKEKGLPVATRQDQIDALFADGISSRDEVTDQSGRGVGMAALKDSVEAMRGRIEIDSTLGEGTCVRFLVPVPAAAGKRNVA